MRVFEAPKACEDETNQASARLDKVGGIRSAMRITCPSTHNPSRSRATRTEAAICPVKCPSLGRAPSDKGVLSFFFTMRRLLPGSESRFTSTFQNSRGDSISTTSRFGGSGVWLVKGPVLQKFEDEIWCVDLKIRKQAKEAVERRGKLRTSLDSA